MFAKITVSSVRIIVLQQHLDALILELGRLGLLQLKTEHRETELQNRKIEASLRAEERDAHDIENTISSLQSVLPATAKPAQNALCGQPDPLMLRQELAYIQKHVQYYLHRKEKLTADINRLRNQADRLQTLERVGLPPNFLGKTGLCFTAVGLLPAAPPVNSPPGFPGLYQKSGRRIVAIAAAHRQNELLAYLNHMGFTDETADLVAACRPGKKPHFRRKADRLNRRLARLERRFEHNRTDWAIRLARMSATNRIRQQTIAAEKIFIYSQSTACMTGWVKQPDRQKLNRILSGICGKAYQLHISEKPEAEAPIVLNNNRFLKPFELLVRTAGLPGNSEIDPTPFAALTYMLLFGVMFGDLGQGLVLMLTGFCLRRLAPRLFTHDRLIIDIGGILVLCGFSAAVFGLLYGSFFSCESLIPALWFHPMVHINDLFLAVILAGGIIIITGLLLNITNLLRAGNYAKALLDRQGAVGLVIYLGGFSLVFTYSRSGTLPRTPAAYLLLGLPLMVFMLRDFIQCLFPKSPRPCASGCLEYLVETFVEILEMVSGFLGNTISFIRAGAFALSHAGLSLALYTLAGIIHPDIFHPVVLLVIVFGNVFIILLEGLICAIQSMRLEFYEFFGKFYRGDGHPFTPFSLSNAIKPATGEPS